MTLTGLGPSCSTARRCRSATASRSASSRRAATPSTAFLNLGHGGIGSLRIGGSFGAGFDLSQGYGYVRGRAAMVVIPKRLDVEVNVQWSPPSASTNNYDTQTSRLSAWFRPGKGKRAWEAYVEAFHRTDAMAETDREFDGAGGGIGAAIW